MWKKIKNHFFYLLWTLINLLQDIYYKYTHKINFNIILMSKYFCLIIVIFFIKKFYSPLEKNYHHKQYLVINFFKSICTFIGILCLFLQLKHTNILDTNLLFYMIPLYDIIFQRICKFPNYTPLRYLLINMINSGIILIYFLSSYSFIDYIYGVLSSLMFSLSNICIYYGKIIWKDNKYAILHDMQIFACFMLFLCILHIYFYPYNILLSIYNNYIILFILCVNGILIQFLLYYLFSRVAYIPSSIMIYCDLFLATIIDIILSHKIPSLIQIYLIISIISISYMCTKYIKE
jgi:drug/metabolite transporter (DMT)-like permease